MTQPSALRVGGAPTQQGDWLSTWLKGVTNKPTAGTTTTTGGGPYPTAEEVYMSSGAYMKEADWSATMGANLGEVTAENWAQGYRPERMTVTQAKNIGVADNWMRENGYVLIGDTWCLSAQTKTWKDYYGGGDEGGGETKPPAATTPVGNYTQNVQWRVGTG